MDGCFSVIAAGDPIGSFLATGISVAATFWRDRPEEVDCTLLSSDLISKSSRVVTEWLKYRPEQTDFEHESKLRVPGGTVITLHTRVRSW